MKSSKIVYSVVMLKLIATILITNAHYENIYPIPTIASGGMLGNVLFMFVSGYLLVNVSTSFFKWIFRRWLRIYIIVWLVSFLLILLGYFTFNKLNPIEHIIYYFAYPTAYHFISTIAILYIPYYIFLRVNYIKDNLICFIILILICQLLIYLLVYDYSYYHIDNVREHMVKFMFFEAMLIGAYFRLHNVRDYKVSKKLIILLLIFSMGVYFTSKTLLSMGLVPFYFQLLNQYILIVLLIVLSKFVFQFENNFKKLNSNLFKVLKFFSTLTLEIYMVQFLIIDSFENVMFPYNWIIVTSLILVTAIIVNKLSKNILKLIIK